MVTAHTVHNKFKLMFLFVLPPAVVFWKYVFVNSVDHTV